MQNSRSLAIDRTILLAPRSLAEVLLYTVAGALMLTAAAQVRIPLGFTPVPVTLQTLVLVLLGALTGWRAGAASAALYVAAGLAGLPVFAGFSAGAASLPTLGYLLAFPAGAAAAGAVWARRSSDSPGPALVAGLACMGVVHAGGFAWLTVVNACASGLTTAWWTAFVQGTAPFLLVDAAKAFAAAALILGAHRGAGRMRLAA